MKVQPLHKILIEQDKRQLWRVVAVPTTCTGLSRDRHTVLSDPYETTKAARPMLELALKAMTWVVG